MLRRLLGGLFIAAAAAGLVFSVVGLVEVWRYRPVVTQKVAETLTVFEQALNTTHDGLAIVGQVVQTTTVDIAALQTTTQALAQALHDTSPMLDSLTRLTSTDFPAAVAATQTSLASAQSSALLIDNVLATLSSTPFLSVGAYQPDVPLHTALAQVSDSLNTLTPALATINSSLVEGQTNLGVMETDLNKIAKTTNGISTALDRAQAVIDQYETVTLRLKEQLAALRVRVPDWLTTLTWILTFILGWLLIAQVALATLGFSLLRSRREVVKEVSASPVSSP
ncbi:MAG: hypothetical protein KA765_17110 [Thermoflexales bacterium]|nr:hypothetical protein [Thermoflexales bacterium]